MQTTDSIKRTDIFGSFFNELLLYSGQYALFYIIMNFSWMKLGYFSDFGHTLLLFILVLQTSLLAKFGTKPLPRFLGSLLAPLIYTIIEARDETDFIFNTAHLFFWVFSLTAGTLQTLFLVVKGRRTKQVLEFVITTLNVVIFLFVYFYFDLQLTIQEELDAGRSTARQAQEGLNARNLAPALGVFFRDPAHVYAVIGGGLLALTLSIGRVKIFALKEMLNELFGRYVDKNIRDRIVGSGGGAKSERRNVCILFADIKNFTSTTERADAEAVTAMLNAAFSRWDSIIGKSGGVIDKFIGDAIMVIFGMNRPETAAENAVDCARAILAELPELKAELARSGLPVIEDLRIGINSGEVILGDIGSPDRRNFTVIGDAVNTASRLESACKEFGTRLLVSESAYRDLPEAIRRNLIRLGELSLKGKAEKITAYTLTS